MKLVNVYVTMGNTDVYKSYWCECNSIDFWKAVWKCVLYLKLDTFDLTTSLLKLSPGDHCIGSINRVYA